MSTFEKINIEVRRHYCWCDSCFCACLYEAINLETGENFKISGMDLLNPKYEVTFSSKEPTYAAYMK